LAFDLLKVALAISCLRRKFSVSATASCCGSHPDDLLFRIQIGDQAVDREAGKDDHRLRGIGCF
jgi:hypothetical protein